MIKNLNKHEKVRDVDLTIKNLIDFESDIVEHWEAGNIFSYKLSRPYFFNLAFSLSCSLSWNNKRVVEE